MVTISTYDILSDDKISQDTPTCLHQQYDEGLQQISNIFICSPDRTKWSQQSPILLMIATLCFAEIDLSRRLIWQTYAPLFRDQQFPKYCKIINSFNKHQNIHIQSPVSFLHLLWAGSVFITSLYFTITDLFRGSFRNIQMALLQFSKGYQVSQVSVTEIRLHWLPQISTLHLLLLKVFVDLC